MLSWYWINVEVFHFIALENQFELDFVRMDQILAGA
jgi:hypothetical protein